MLLAFFFRWGHASSPRGGDRWCAPRSSASPGASSDTVVQRTETPRGEVAGTSPGPPPPLPPPPGFCLKIPNRGPWGGPGPPRPNQNKKRRGISKISHVRFENGVLLLRTAPEKLGTARSRPRFLSTTKRVSQLLLL